MGPFTGLSAADLDRLSQVPVRYKGMGGYTHYHKLIDKKQTLKQPQMITFDLPFTRLEAKPQALRDNLKNLIATPFMVSKKGERPYVELDRERQKLVNPVLELLEQKAYHGFKSKESGQRFRKLIKKTFKQSEFHAAHVEWIDRIRDLWKKLDDNYLFEKYSAVQARIETNKKRIKVLEGENMYERKILQKKTKDAVRRKTKAANSMTAREKREL